MILRCSAQGAGVPTGTGRGRMRSNVQSRQEWIDGFLGRYRMTCFRLKVLQWKLERVARSAGR